MDFDYKSAAEFLRKKEIEEQKKRRQLLKIAQKDFHSIVEMIKTYNPKKIYQWGSLLNKDDFDENSDIDIAVEGIDSPKKFFELYGKAMEMTEFPLHLVEIEKLAPPYRDSIIKKGKIVYEKGKDIDSCSRNR